MRLLFVFTLVAVAGAPVAADTYVVGSESGQALYPWRGC
jgi:hypothetical protein